MKVYMVLNGDYGDVFVTRVFLDRNKAEKYIKSSDGWIKEMETSDDLNFKEITYISAEYSIWEDEEDIEFNLEIKRTNTLDNNEKDINFSMYFDGADYRELFIKRVIKDECNQESLEQKYKKVCQDVMIEIDNLVKSGKYEENKIDDWLKENIDKYI